MGLKDRIQELFHSWNAFSNSRDHPTYNYDPGQSYYYRPDRFRFSGGNERSIVTSVYNRIAMDAADIDIEHVRLDENDRYLETIKSNLNDCFNVEANLDQTGRAFKQDVFMSILDEGCIAIVPTDTSINPNNTSSYDILSMRTGKILEWRPDKVKVRLYNEKTGKREDLWVNKRNCAIVENPLYAVMNEPNSTMQRLKRKLALLDAVDEKTCSGKMDLIVQLPYLVKTDARKTQADKRRDDIQQQLQGPYGIAYIDGTEKVIQLNRPIENNLPKQIEYLTNLLMSQLGITQGILDGSADETTMTNYYARIIKLLVAAVVDECKRKFLTKTARSQRQSIMYFRDPFTLVPVTKIAEMSDALGRNEIATSNEIRQEIGWKPSTDPNADQLRNSNLYHPGEESYPGEEPYPEDYVDPEMPPEPGYEETY
jgi:hypothetical protein